MLTIIMEIDRNLVENPKIIAEKLLKAIEKDSKINSVNSLNFQAIKNNLPAICHTVIQAIANNNPSLLAVYEKNQGSQHGFERSGQNFEPQEIAREFFLLKQIIIAELKPQFVKQSSAETIEQLALVDLVINRVLENSFRSYAEVREKQIDNLHQQIFLTNQEITRMIAAHQDSLAYLVHEIKNPLTSIIGYSDLFLRQQRKYDTSVTDLQHIQQVLQQGRNILRLINDILEIDSSQKGDLKLRIVPVDICLLIDDIVLGLKPFIEAKQLKLITSCQPEKLIVKSDYLRLQQIITNLLTNAIRYTPTGTIKLTCRKTEPNLIKIMITDTGIGISESDLKRVFEPYFRSTQSHDTVPEGIGLGLAIVSQLVTMLQGKIELISQVNIGSTFTVTIPIN